MKRCLRQIVSLAATGVLLLSCGGGGPSGPSFDELITEGWLAFARGDYQTAFENFSDAQASNAADAESYTGLGWSLLQLDDLTNAEREFRVGSTKTNVTADLLAGWAFVLNALKDYEASNTEAGQALALDPTWSFSHGLALATGDLRVLRAENFFLLGAFASSLTEVQTLNPSFTADVSTTQGQDALAREIERLSGTS